MKKILILMITITLVACESDDDGPSEDPRVLRSLNITSSNGAEMEVGQRISLILNGFDQAGDPMAITSVITWSVNNDNAEVDQNGQVTALKAGVSTVTAETNDLQADFQLSVTEMAVPILTRLAITSESGNTLDLQESPVLTLTINGFDQFDASFEITEVTWSVSNNNASVNQEGQVTALATGTTEVGANVGEVTTSFEVTITDIFSQEYHIYVSDAGGFSSGPWKIMRYDQNGENPKVFTEENLGWPQDILFLEDKNEMLISNLNTGVISRHNATTGVYIDGFATDIGGPTRMKIGPDGYLYVLQWQGSGLVFRYMLDGTFIDEFTSVAISQSIGLDWDGTGNLYVSSFDGATVRKFDSQGNDLGIFIDSNLEGPTNIWFDEEGNLLVNDWNGGVVSKFDADGNFVEIFASGLNQCEGIAFLPEGNLLIGNGGTGAVKMFEENGDFLEDFVPSGLGGLLTPNAVIIRKL